MLTISDCLEHYMNVSGQKVNVGKSCFFLNERHNTWATEISEVSGFKQGFLPFVYLGVPIYRGPKWTNLFLFIRGRISERIHSWSHRHLSFGGRLILIKSVLGAIPIHIFQALEPTKGALKQIEQVLARYLWGSCYSTNKTHWIKWERVCLPCGEGGLGIRRLKEVVEAFSLKMWWRFREQDSLWARYMFQKFCSISFPLVLSRSNRFSPMWRRMFKAGLKYKECFGWVLGEGIISFWYDTWLLDVPLASLCGPQSTPFPQRVCDFWIEDEWDEEELWRVFVEQGVPLEVIEKILLIPFDRGERDRARWRPSPNGNFSVSSAWEVVRHRAEKRTIYDFIWGKCIGTSISFFLWRHLANRVPVDTKLQWRGISLASKCK